MRRAPHDTMDRECFAPEDVFIDRLCIPYVMELYSDRFSQLIDGYDLGQNKISGESSILFLKNDGASYILSCFQLGHLDSNPKIR